MKQKIVLLAGDGIGPEVIAQAQRILEALLDNHAIAIEHALIGGVAIDACNSPLPNETLTAIADADAVLLGAVGAPQYDSLSNDKKPEKGLLDLRKQMGVFANLRPARCYPELINASSLKPELVSGLDLLIVRELIGGIYFGEPRGIITENHQRVAINTMRYGEDEIIRIARTAFEAARGRQKRLCSVEKANVLEVGLLWREIVSALGKSDYPDVELNHIYADNAAMQLIRQPKQFDVIVTGNLFGDILSDAAAMLTGSIGMLPSASINDTGVGLYEPVHGSAPDIAGLDIANPLATILSAAMLLRYSLQANDLAETIENAVAQVLADGYRCADIASADDKKTVGCSEMGTLVLQRLGG